MTAIRDDRVRLFAAPPLVTRSLYSVAHRGAAAYAREMGRRIPRPDVDKRIDAILASRLSPAQHRDFWEAEAPMLGRLTPREALGAGEREAVIELALGRPGADRSMPLISDAHAQQIFVALERELHRGHLR